MSSADGRRYLPGGSVIPLAVLGLALAAGSGLGLARLLDGESTVSRPVAARPTPSPAAPGGCAGAALTRADTLVDRSRRLEAALAAHTLVLDDLLAARVGADEAVQRSLPVLTGAATDRRLFLEEAAAYEQAREGCRD